MPRVLVHPSRLAVSLLTCLSLLLVSCSQDAVEVAAPGENPSGPLLAIGSDPVTGAAIETNKDDYMPGEIVHVVGRGWTAGETVALVMTEDPDTHEDVTGEVQADSVGGFSIHFYDVQPHDLGVRFTLTATGQTSGSVAVATFTDGNVILASSAPVTGVTTFAITNGDGTTCSFTNTTFVAGSTIGFTGSAGYPKCTEVRVPSSVVVSSVTYNFVSWTVTELKCSGNTLTTTEGTAGTEEFIKFTACGSGTTGTITAVYEAEASNAAPELAAIGNQSVQEGNLLSFTATATDDGLPAPPTFTYTLETPGAACLLLHPQVPAGAAITTGGAFTWTPTEAEGPQTYCARIQVSDGALADFEDIEIQVTEANAAPTLDLIGPQNVNELVELQFQASATDTDLPANTLTYSIEDPGAGCANPYAAGAQITGAGAFTWTPTEAQGPGTYCVRVVVSDGTDSDSELVVITVAEVNLPPVLTAIGSQNINELVELQFQAAATDADLPANTLTYSIEDPGAGCANPYATGAQMTGAGAFTWTPTEAQGPGTYCVRVVVSDGTDTDSELVVITVAEVNLQPTIDVPDNITTQWGVPLSPQATADDDDIPANTLTFSLQGTIPAGMTINSGDGTISWTPGSGQVGVHTITVRVTDNGDPVLYDEDTFTITVTVRPTKLEYTGNFAGQYSDKDWLRATLTDDGDGDLNGDAISGKSVRFTFGGTNVGMDATDGSGVAEFLYRIPKPDGTYAVTANFNGDAAYAGSNDSDNFDVDAEDANVIPDPTNQNGYNVGSPGGTGSFTWIYKIEEDETPAPEPLPNDGALAGDIGNAGFTLALKPVGGGTTLFGSCGTGTVTGTGYASYKTYTCNFSGVPVGSYETEALVANGGSPAAAYYRGHYDDVVTISDPSLGFVTGGGKFLLDGDWVSFGLVANYTGKGKTTARGNLVVVRHHADGSSCRTKSNAVDGPAIIGNTATFTGKANYGCVDAVGAPLPGGAGNLNLTGYVEDNGEPGSSSALTPDKFWVRVMGELLMTTPANSTNAKPLIGGNIQVPQPQKKP